MKNFDEMELTGDRKKENKEMMSILWVLKKCDYHNNHICSSKIILADTVNIHFRQFEAIWLDKKNLWYKLVSEFSNKLSIYPMTADMEAGTCKKGSLYFA